MSLSIAIKVRILSYLLPQKAFTNPKSDVLTRGANSMHVKTVFLFFVRLFVCFTDFTVFLAYLKNIIESSKYKSQLL